MPMALELPNAWNPRPHQRRLWGYLQGGGRRAVAVWHRRAGKDSTALNWTASAAMLSQGLFWHMLPTQRQARRVVWDGIDTHGRRVIDQVFPKEIVRSRNVAEMKVELVNGSLWQLCGSDNFDALVGANPIGVVFSEWSLTNPAAWDYIRPILAENGGWALFIYTPRGRNHGHTLFRAAQEAGWFAERLTVEDTGAISLGAIEEERRSGMSEPLIKQEFYCSWDAAILGSFVGDLVDQAERDGRICDLPFDPLKEVHTAWDLGIGGNLAIWMAQQDDAGAVRIIRYWSPPKGEAWGVEQAGQALVKQYPYRWGLTILPHDASSKSVVSGRTADETLRTLGFHQIMVLPRESVQAGVIAARRLIPQCYFDRTHCAHGIDALRSWRREWDDDKQVFRDQEEHDWASHPGAAMRYLGLGLPSKQPAAVLQDMAVRVRHDYDPHAAL